MIRSLRDFFRKSVINKLRSHFAISSYKITRTAQHCIVHTVHFCASFNTRIAFIRIHLKSKSKTVS